MKRETYLSTFLIAFIAGQLGCSSGEHGQDASSTTDEDLIAFAGSEQESDSVLGDDSRGADSHEAELPLVDPDLNPGSATIDGAIARDLENDSWDIPGQGSEFAGPPLDPKDGPESAEDCIAARVERGNPTEGEARCFYGDDPDIPAARIDQVVEVVDGEEWVHIRLTLNPNFVDNSYGETAVGWGGQGDEGEQATVGDADMPAGEADDEMEAKLPKGDKPKKRKTGHTFKDLVGSDHAEIKITDSAGDVVLHFKIDYLSEDASAVSGYSSLGVNGGDGKLIEGDASWIVAWTTALDRNFNACGLDGYTESSPLPASGTDSEGEEPYWDYRVVYDVWVSGDAFGDEEFGEAYIEYVHASPSKGENNSVDVVPGDCPPDDAPPREDPPKDDTPPDTDGAGGSPGMDDGDGGSGGDDSTPPRVDVAR